MGSFVPLLQLLPLANGLFTIVFLVKNQTMVKLPFSGWTIGKLIKIKIEELSISNLIFKKFFRKTPFVCLSVCLSAYLSACQPTLCLPAYLCVCPPICLPVRSSVYLSVRLFACLRAFLFICLLVHLSVCPPVCLSACLSVSPPVCLSVR
jgi:hypothetical protein